MATPTHIGAQSHSAVVSTLKDADADEVESRRLLVLVPKLGLGLELV